MLVVLLAFVFWLAINARLPLYASFITKAGHDVSLGGNLGGIWQGFKNIADGGTLPTQPDTSGTLPGASSDAANPFADLPIYQGIAAGPGGDITIDLPGIKLPPLTVSP